MYTCIQCKLLYYYYDIKKEDLWIEFKAFAYIKQYILTQNHASSMTCPTKFNIKVILLVRELVLLRLIH